GQDQGRARTTRKLIKKLRDEGKTIFLTTHNMAEADEICDRVGFLVDGRIPVTGVPAELKRRFGQPTLKVITGGEKRTEHVFDMRDIGSNEKFLKLLASREIVSMHTAEASLDDVFIKATGIKQ
ncbi:MAG: ABC transporter ATP-binding protein, partial [Alphaproteobacteria bacterium]|nr:ABC transporter ATP-binding protein [Alphaproteobacteria bacterium]